MPRLLSKEWWEERVLRMYDSWRDPVTWHVTETPEGPGDLRQFKRRRFALLVTYKRNGDAVPSAMWFGLKDGRAYLRTGCDSWKVRRMRNNPQVLFAPSNIRGKPKGAVLACTARILPDEEKPAAARIIAGAYGAGRKLYDRTVATVYEEAAYIEITPDALLKTEAATRARAEEEAAGRRVEQARD
ncbi:PPOX class F420-dependent oxidoreductase [Streptomyces sp. BH-SS-21]|uniref:PPOX class F420-dependent oxidoreductase n=1 Tax=Streptomyces liliiviolaceus TaxID=2823109 RepID=A0A940XVQ2_9ACTN|nr:PPOX class F420-dependent oxidoreductase [Streptomyces liliiviolaceus]MBQ0850981.1 PPOX class F420-dependent oxidoreductase [Streptomyces liliiviolaceus]